MLIIYSLFFFLVPPDINDEETVSDITVNEGENATLVCKAKGNPLPKITWKREDGQKIAMRNKPKKILCKKLVLDINKQTKFDDQTKSIISFHGYF